VEVRTADLLATQQRIEEVARLDALAAEAATLMTGTDDPRRLLQGCAEAAVRYLDAAFARIWLVDADDMLVLRASAGMYTRLDGAHARIRMGEFKIGRIARDRAPHLTNAVVGDPEVHDQSWAVREGMVAFAGYPLVVNGVVVGVLAVFARRSMSDATFEGLGRLAQVIALGIQRQRAEIALRELAETLERRVEARTAELASSEERVRRAFDAAPSGMMKTDPDGRILLVNAEMEKLFGYSRAEMLGQTVEMLLPEDLRESHVALREAWFRNPSPQGLGTSRELRARRKDGSEFTVEVGLMPVSTASGLRALLTLQDVTARKASEARIRMLTTELETRVAERTAQLQATLREQAQIAYLVMHNLRTPLRAIHARTRILTEEGSLTAEMCGHVEAIAHNAVTLGAQIDDLVRFSTLFQRAVQKQFVASDTVLDEALTELEGERQGREIEIVRTPLPPCWAEPALLQELFRNLLSNAFKFTRTRARARIEISGEVDATHGVCFTVRDDGIGFDMRFCEKIFGLFQRLNSSGAYEGTGCGLALSKRIVELHGGSIEAQGEPGRGATFRFCLPGPVASPDAPR
jgi:PAS domain S-box-containing protein